MGVAGNFGMQEEDDMMDTNFGVDSAGWEELLEVEELVLPFSRPRQI